MIIKTTTRNKIALMREGYLNYLQKVQNINPRSFVIDLSRFFHKKGR